jgi:hypothetical protein
MAENRGSTEARVLDDLKQQEASMKGKAKRQARRARPSSTPEPRVESLEPLRELEAKARTGLILTGGDVDADWQRAASSGEEAVGGSVATPDQDVVDEIGEALGVPQASDAEVRTSEEILRDRDRRYWELERKAADDTRSS